MPEHYHDENDLKLMRDMRKLAPDDFNAWLGLNSIIGRDNGAIPKKYRELIATIGAPRPCGEKEASSHSVSFCRAFPDFRRGRVDL